MKKLLTIIACATLAFPAVQASEKTAAAQTMVDAVLRTSLVRGAAGCAAAGLVFWGIFGLGPHFKIVSDGYDVMCEKIDKLVQDYPSLKKGAQYTLPLAAFVGAKYLYQWSVRP